MSDVRRFNRINFSDVSDLVQAESYIPKSRQGKTVNFLDKFGDFKNTRGKREMEH